MALVSNELIQVVPLSPPSSQLLYFDVTYGKQEKRIMQRFKIKYTNTKGVVKTRSIKASSEAKAMSQIKDMAQHHYTITESVDEEPKRKSRRSKIDLSQFAPSGIYTKEIISKDEIDRIASQISEEILSKQKKELIEKWAPIITAQQGIGKSDWMDHWGKIASLASTNTTITATRPDEGIPVGKILGFSDVQFPVIRRVTPTLSLGDPIEPVKAMPQPDGESPSNEG